MTDPELVAKKLALIETCVEQLRSLAHPDAIRRDVREERFVEHTLQIAIQAAMSLSARSDDASARGRFQEQLLLGAPYHRSTSRPEILPKLRLSCVATL